MVRLAWQMVRQRPASVIATVVALCLAVAVVTACGVMLESGLRFHGTPQRYAAAPVLVSTTGILVTSGSGDNKEVESNPLAEGGRVPAALTGRIAALPGVRAAIGDVAVDTQLLTRHHVTAVQAHPWSAARLAPYTLRAGTAPVAPGQVVLDRRLVAGTGVRPGGQVRLALPGGPRTFTVSGVAAATGAAPSDATVFLDDAQARTLSGSSDRVDVIGVLPDRGVDVGALATAVRGVLPAEPDRPAGTYPRVLTGADRGGAESVGVSAGREFVIAVSGAAGGSTLLIAVIVISGSVALSVQQRHRDIALLRAIAATPRQVRRMVVRETGVLGVAAGAAGIWPGLHAAGWLRDQFVSHGLAPDTFRTHISWLPPVVAAAAALLVAVAAGWIASRRASRIRPTEALAESSVERTRPGIVRSVVGLVALAGGIALCVVAGNGSGGVAASVLVPTVFVFVVAVALWSPLLIRATAATFGRLLGGFGVTGRLAAANTGASAYRLSAVVSSLVLAVALGGSMWFVPASEEHAAAQQSRAGLVAGYVATPAAPGLQPGVAEAIRRTAGVRAATGIVRSTLFAPQGNFSDFTAMGADAGGLARTVDLGVTSGSISALRGDTVAVDTLAARALHLHVGSHFHGWFGDGDPADLRVVAVYTRGLGFAQMTLPRGLLVGHTTSRLDDAVFVTTAADRPQAASRVRAELDRLAPGSSLQARDTYQVGVDKNLAENTWTNQLIAGVLLLYVVIAAVNTLIMAALARRREIAILRLAGTTRTQVLRMVGLEQALLLGLALALGAAIATATLLPTVRSLTGSAVPTIPPTAWVAVIGGTVLLAGAGIVPVRRALRMHPVEAVGVRE